MSFVRIATGFVAGKVVAIFTGAEGIAIIGAFTNFINIVLTFANGAVNTGVIKYTAEWKDDDPKLKLLFSTSLKISLYCSFLVAIVLTLFARELSSWIFANSIYQGPVRVLGLTCAMYSVNSLLISILNGKGQIKSYTIVNAVGSVVGLAFTSVLVFVFKIEGALYALVLSQSISLIATVIAVRKSAWFTNEYFKGKISKPVVSKLCQFSWMAIITAITLPASQIVLRNIVISRLGIEAAGQWQGLMRISDGYLLLVTTSLSTYYLPKLSSLKSNRELRKEIIKGYSFIMPIVLLGCLLIYLLRLFIIETLYTPDFIVMEDLFLWQLVGDFFKIASWILAYLMLAKAMVKKYIITEIVSVIGYIILSYLFLSEFGLKGVTISFALNYILYFALMVYIFKGLLFKNDERAI